MAVTPPIYAVSPVTATLNMQGNDYESQCMITIDQARLDAWSDDDLTTKLAALRAAFEAMLPSGTGCQYNITWQSSSFATSNIYPVPPN